MMNDEAYNFFNLKSKLTVIIKNYTQNMDKENIGQQRGPLTPNNSRKAHQHTPRNDYKFQRQDPLLTVVAEEITNNKQCDLLGVILADPLLKELNISLEKQAEQQKKCKLLQSFPLRYKNLVHTETLYKKIVGQLKEQQRSVIQIQYKHQKQRQNFIGQIQTLKCSLTRKDEQINTLNENYLKEKQHSKRQSYIQYQRIYKSSLMKEQQFKDLQRKILKLKSDRDNINQYLQEIKEQSDNLKKQNDRIVQTLTLKQLDIGNLHNMVIQGQNMFKKDKEKLLTEIALIQQKYSNQLSNKSNQLYQLTSVTDGLRTRLKQCQDQIIQLLKQKQALQNVHTNEIQVIRDRFLQTIQNKNDLVLQIDIEKKRYQQKIQELKQQIEFYKNQSQKKELYIKQINLQHELELYKSKQSYFQQNFIKKSTIEGLENKINLCIQEKMEIQQRNLRLQAEKQNLIQSQATLKTEIYNLNKILSNSNYQQRKNQKKHKQIDILVNKFKDQLSKYNQIIQQKQLKIQSYRKQIINLRKQVKQLSFYNDQIKRQSQQIHNQICQISDQRNSLKNELAKSHNKEMLLSEKIEQYYKFINKQKLNSETQVEIIKGVNDKDIVQLETLLKQLQKTKLKYQNVVQELNQYKKQFNEQLKQKQTSIREMELQNINIKELINNKMYEGNEIEKILDIKIKDLKGFYEQKIEEQGKKYRRIIQTLKGQMTELYKDIDLKKSMQQQMFSEIMRINQSRRAMNSCII